MALKFRKKILLAKIEGTYATDPTPVGATNAILCSNVSINPFQSEPIERDTYQAFLGARQQIHAGTRVEISFDVELAGGGAAGTAPLYGPLLRGCGMAETTNAGVSVVYDPVSAAEESVTIYLHHDGQKFELNGARGTFSIEMNVKRIPVLRFSFVGLYVGPAATSDPTQDVSGFQTPLTVGNTNTPTFTLHSYSGKMASFSYVHGNTVAHRELVGEESVQISDRRASGNIVIEHPALGIKDFYAIAAAETLAALQIVHGTTAGNIVQLDAPKVQILTPSMSEMDAITMLNMGLNFVPDSGDDEMSITVK